MSKFCFSGSPGAHKHENLKMSHITLCVQGCGGWGLKMGSEGPVRHARGCMGGCSPWASRVASLPRGASVVRVEGPRSAPHDFRPFLRCFQELCEQNWRAVGGSLPRAVSLIGTSVSWFYKLETLSAKLHFFKGEELAANVRGL